MTRRVILVRHGRTAWNGVDRAQGWADVPLDDVGRAQAESCAPALADYGPTVLWSSDLERAQQTAAVIAARVGLDVRHDERLREFDLGVRSGMLRSEFEAAYPAEYAAWIAGLDTPLVAGEETTAEVAGRLAACWSDLLNTLPTGETALVVTHGAALKVLTCVALGLPLEVRALLVGVGNCHWIELVETDAGDRFRLGAYNLCTPDFTSAEGVG